MSEPILSQSYGYGFAIGLGAAFALIMALITRVLSRFLGQVQNSERFSTASRNVKAGLISSSTVSAWTWPATLLSSGAWSYSHGVSGGYFYGIGGTVQITLFMFLAIQLKKRAPAAHTLPECFYLRYGMPGHVVFLCYCMATNILISSLLLLGGSQGFATTTGMHTVAASFLLPLGVMVYTALGGLKATIVSDWIHTVIVYGILLGTCFAVYGSSSLIGSPGKMYDMLKDAQAAFPSSTGESYLSFKDPEMFFLSWSVTLGGFGSVFGDPGYSQRAIAAHPAEWIIPVSLGSAAGLACRALLTNPASVTYPNQLTDFEVGAGLPVIYGMAAIFGKKGAAAGLAMLFMSVTSATSAELIAFSSVTTYDVYRTYFKPDATGKQLVFAAHTSVIAFGIFMAALATVLNYVGVTVSWLLSFLGIVLTPEVSAIILTLYWPRMTTLGLVIGAPLGTVTGVVCWIASTYHFGDGVINKETLMISKCTFVGNITAIFSAPIYIAVISLLKPDEQPFDLGRLQHEIKAGDDVDEEVTDAMVVTAREQRLLRKQEWACVAVNVFLFLVPYIIIPCVLYGTGDFSKSSFKAFIVILLIWAVVAALYITMLPLVQGWSSITTVVLSLFRKDTKEIISDPVEEEDISDSVEEEEVVYESKNSH